MKLLAYIPFLLFAASLNIYIPEPQFGQTNCSLQFFLPTNFS